MNKRLFHLFEAKAPKLHDKIGTHGMRLQTRLTVWIIVVAIPVFVLGGYLINSQGRQIMQQQAKLDGFISPDGVGIDAVLMIAEPLGVTPGLAKFCYEHKIPIGGDITTLEYGSIFALLPQPSVAGQQAALLADKILKGTPAGTIPVVTPEQNLIINHKVSQGLGLMVPTGLLSEASQIIC